MQPEDLGLLVTAADPRLSRDGALVACVVTSVDLEANRYRSRVWAGPTDGSAPLRPVTAGGTRRDQRPRWSPDGTALAFTARAEGEAAAVVVMPWAQAGEAREVAHADAAEDVEELEWSPDGRWLAYLARVPDPALLGPEREADRPPRRLRRLGWRYDGVGWLDGRRKALFVVATDGTAPPRRLAAFSTSDVFELAWAPDSRRLAFTAAPHEEADLDRRVDLFVVSVEGGEPERVTPTDASRAAPAWSPDGAALVHYRSNGRRLPDLARPVRRDLATGEERVLGAELDRFPASVGTLRPPAWHDGRWCWLVEDGGEGHVVAAPDDGGPVEVLLDGRVVTAFDLAAGVLAVIEGTWQAPAELVVLDAASGRGPGRGERWRTDLGASLREVCELPVGERFTVPHDGGDVHAWLVRPAGFEEGRSYPVLVNIHGGPFAQYTDAFFDEFAVQAGAGYAVVACNPRGSSGRGAAWGRAISASLRDDEDGDDKDGGDAAGGDAAGSPGWGDVDAADVLAVVDAALARWPWLDAARVGVLGGSYGGYLTSWLAARTDRFAAACSERAVNNLLTMTHTSDIGWWFNTGYMGVGQEDPMALLERSPVTYADDITAPMLLLHSEADLRCPIEQAEDLFTRLRRRHHDVELVRFPAESHGLSRGGAPRHRVQRFEIQLEFFARHLHPAGAAAGATPG